MKKLFLIALTTCLFVIIALIVKDQFLTNGGSTGAKDTNARGQEVNTPKVVEEVKQGIITIMHTDNASLLPIRDTEFTIVDSSTGKAIEKITTSADGKAVSSKLDYGGNYLVKQSKVMEPYELDEQAIGAEVNQKNQEVSFESEIPAYVKGYEWTEDGLVKLSEVYIDVPMVMQKPELPNGCEITSLTSVLNGMGYDHLTKEIMADEFLPKEAFYRKDGKLYGADPNKAYAGNPRDKIAWFSYAPPIIEAANKVFSEFGGDYTPIDKTGSTREEIYAELDQGNPVVIWVTLDLSPPQVTSSWYFSDTGELFNAPVNLHCVVLNGYSSANNRVHVMNPLEGQVTYDADEFFASYDALGTHAMVIH